MDQQTQGEQKKDAGEMLRTSVAYNAGMCRHIEAKKGLGTGTDSFRVMGDVSLRLDMEALQMDLTAQGTDAVAKHLGESILRALAA